METNDLSKRKKKKLRYLQHQSTIITIIQFARSIFFLVLHIIITNYDNIILIYLRAPRYTYTLYTP